MNHQRKFSFLGHSDSLSFQYSALESNGVHVLGCTWGNPRYSYQIFYLFNQLRKIEDQEFALDVTIFRGPGTADEFAARISDTIDFSIPINRRGNIAVTNCKQILVPDGSCGIDSRTGLFVSYDPSLDPIKRRNPRSESMLQSFSDWALEDL